MLDLITRAVHFGLAKHGTQTRKYSGLPYFIHCAEVAQIVAGCTPDPDMVAAAYLHDVLEDTDTSVGELEAVVGPRAAQFVVWLTNEPMAPGLNRARRKAMDRERLSRAPWQVHTIKLADLISNAPSIRDNDPGFARVYHEEARALIPCLSLGDLGLRARLLALLDTFPT